MKTDFSTIRKTVATTSQIFPKNQTQKLEAAFKELQQKFSQIPEIGKFKAIKVTLENPIAGSIVKKAAIVVEPLADKNDFRTRVLTFIAQSPFDKDTTYTLSPANGNKFSIDSALRNPKIKTLFKNFIKSAEQTFEIQNYTNLL